jgi:hypothetical protein
VPIILRPGRDLALAKIVADALAEHRRLAGVVERIVYKLKGESKVAAAPLIVTVSPPVG